MPKYMFQVRYTSEGLAGILHDGGSARRAVAEGLAKNLGGSLDAFYFAFGDTDAYVIGDLPDNRAAAKLAMTVSSSGRVQITTIPLLTVDEVDTITEGRQLEYSPPGG